MESLFNLTRGMARILKKGGLWAGTSTASTTLTLTDATIGLVAGAVDGGTIWFHDEAIPTTRIITTLSAAGVVTWTPAVAGLTGAQNYTIFGSVYPRTALRNAVNMALENIGEFAAHGTFNSVGLQEDYDMTQAAPVGVPTANRIMTVEVSAYSDPGTGASAVDNAAWALHFGWGQFGNTLRFFADPPVFDGLNGNVRIGWNVLHAELTTDADEILREVSPNRLKWEAVQEAYMFLISSRDSQVLDEQTQNLFNRSVAMAGRFQSHANQPLPEPMLLIGVGSRGGAGVNIDGLT